MGTGDKIDNKAEDVAGKVKEGVGKEEAEAAKAKLVEAGATADVK